ncbi:MAG: hypothetical protein K9K32_05445 [Halanaerobiales bacterium]|nr:hypothetical protein [Halanaerobiales bacterium]
MKLNKYWKRPIKLIQAIDYLYHNKNVCIEMGKNARKAFETKYTPKIITQKYYNLIRKEVLTV